MNVKMATLMIVLAAGAARATEPVATDAQARMTTGKLAVDTGAVAEGERLFGELALDAAVPESLRCEARVRQAAAAAIGENPERALDMYITASTACAAHVEAMRLLVEAVTGVQQDPATWQGRTEQVSLLRADVESKARLLVAFSGVVESEGAPSPSNTPAFTGEPIDISMRDAKIADVLQLFSSVIGQSISLDSPDIGERTITLELSQVPWDQALALVLGSNGLRAERGESGIRVMRNTFTSKTGDEARLLIRNTFTTKTGDEALLQTVSLCMQAYKVDNGQFPVATDWRPVADLAALVEPTYVKTLPRLNLSGLPIQYRSADGTSFEVRVGETALEVGAADRPVAR